MNYAKFLSIGLMVLLACDSNKSGQEEPTPKCHNVLIINEIPEEFCGGTNIDLASKLIVGDSLILIADTNQPYYNQSQNYLGYRLTFATKKQASNDYDSEIKLFQHILDKMNPRSIHEFDINKDGGFALEAWAKDGTYYSTELGEQTDSTYVGILNVLIEINGAGQVNNKILLEHEVHGKIILWNEVGQFIIVNPYYHGFIGFHSWD